jgi:hypothetical protein
MRVNRSLSSVWTTRAAALLASVAICALPAAAASAGDIGPGPGSVTVRSHGYLVDVRITPNSSSTWNDIDLRVSRRGAAIRGAVVSARFEMPAMSMGARRFQLPQVRPGLYRYSGPAVNMGGLWVLTFQIRPAGATAFTVVVRDHVRG